MCGRYLFFDQNNARIRSLLALLERQLGDEPLSELSLGEVFHRSGRRFACCLSREMNWFRPPCAGDLPIRRRNGW